MHGGMQEADPVAECWTPATVQSAASHQSEGRCYGLLQGLSAQCCEESSKQRCAPPQLCQVCWTSQVRQALSLPEHKCSRHDHLRGGTSELKMSSGCRHPARNFQRGAKNGGSFRGSTKRCVLSSAAQKGMLLPSLTILHVNHCLCVAQAAFQGSLTYRSRICSCLTLPHGSCCRS